eukprot:GHVS01030369.1.p1 GENE.GHVS01030369.1~~GHVS01030369.1.p1  ORF type:complete len:170 (+),score=35.11 GHVS01030369.1:61-570(+)
MKVVKKCSIYKWADHPSSLIPPLTPSCTPAIAGDDFSSTLHTNNATPCVLWACTYKHNCYTRKANDKVTLTSEPLNWTGVHCERYSGLTNRKGAVGVKLGKKKGKLSVVMRNTSEKQKEMRKPNRMTRECHMSCSGVGGGKIERLLTKYNPGEMEGVKEQLGRISKTKQ